jgi:hypothetical protein
MRLWAKAVLGEGEVDSPTSHLRSASRVASDADVVVFVDASQANLDNHHHDLKALELLLSCNHQTP